jgi:tRNA dimethylallyltransferase
LEEYKNVIVIIGPTASGKTTLSIELAKRIYGEIISCDSMIIYKDMNIGTAKPTKEEMQGIRHYMIDIIEPNKEYSVAKYRKQAEDCIETILSKGKIPIIVGGTGLYYTALTEGIKFQESEVDWEYRKELQKEAKENGLYRLYERLKSIDEIAVGKIHPNDEKRIVRALEVYKTTGYNITYHNEMSKKEGVKYNYIVFGINIDRDILYDRINKRVDVMIKSGLITEVEQILKKYNNFPTSMQGLGYKEVKQYIDGHISKEEMIETLKIETRRYAKRQMTWFKRYENINWLDKNNSIEENLKQCLNKINELCY